MNFLLNILDKRKAKINNMKKKGLRESTILLNYRFGNWVHYRCKILYIKQILWFLYKIWYKFLIDFIMGTEIPAETKMGKNVKLEHGGKGVVINPQSIIGSNVIIYHQVTIGGFGLAHFDEQYINENQKKGGAPIIGNSVIIGTGAKILGPVKIGDGARVGANAVVINDVPPDSTAVGVPAKIILNKE
ncbi:serine O-acetyltransferase [Bacillus sp. AFS031507]|uniref:serine O-acetyltransferase n=1 Tax=Bacillus sp. AFS031507 TaxID=2033496 RepID=UPI000BFD9A5D|nr:serine acetyltransferase [Bacillus sp. AFS031507]PGY12667.1 serine acetyltransferase [Bacillus sp. AFS031507]